MFGTTFVGKIVKNGGSLAILIPETLEISSDQINKYMYVKLNLLGGFTKSKHIGRLVYQWPGSKQGKKVIRIPKRIAEEYGYYLGSEVIAKFREATETEIRNARSSGDIHSNKKLRRKRDAQVALLKELELQKYSPTADKPLIKPKCRTRYFSFREELKVLGNKKVINVSDDTLSKLGIQPGEIVGVTIRKIKQQPVKEVTEKTIEDIVKAVMRALKNG